LYVEITWPDGKLQPKADSEDGFEDLNDNEPEEMELTTKKWANKKKDPLCKLFHLILNVEILSLFGLRAPSA
jgi:hypothetical protein